jgi:hypothetical protein
LISAVFLIPEYRVKPADANTDELSATIVTN